MFEQESIARTSKAPSFSNTGFLAALLLVSAMMAGAPGWAADVAKTPPTEAEFKLAKDNVQAAPRDFKTHFALGELYKRSGSNKDAVKEYALTTELNPAY